MLSPRSSFSSSSSSVEDVPRENFIFGLFLPFQGSFEFFDDRLSNPIRIATVVMVNEINFRIFRIFLWEIIEESLRISNDNCLILGSIYETKFIDNS